jgi:CheY-like chemotaxis protein
MPTPLVLLVEDNQIDALLFKKAMKLACPEATVMVVEEVRDAFFYLSGVPPYSDRNLHPFPYLIVVDLNLAAVPGMDLIKWIRGQPAMNDLVIIVLTASEQPQDEETAFALGANSFIKKLFRVEPLAASLKILHEKMQETGSQPPADATQPPAPV